MSYDVIDASINKSSLIDFLHRIHLGKPGQLIVCGFDPNVLYLER